MHGMILNDEALSIMLCFAKFMKVPVEMLTSDSCGSELRKKSPLCQSSWMLIWQRKAGQNRVKLKKGIP